MGNIELPSSYSSVGKALHHHHRVHGSEPYGVPNSQLQMYIMSILHNSIYLTSTHFCFWVKRYSELTTVNSRLADTPLLQTLAITVKIQFPIYRGLTENDSQYSRLSLFWTQNDLKVSATTIRVDCTMPLQNKIIKKFLPVKAR